MAKRENATMHQRNVHVNAYMYENDLLAQVTYSRRKYGTFYAKIVV